MAKIKLKTFGFFLMFMFTTALSYSQINVNYVFTSDSLNGFNEQTAKETMRTMVMDPADQKGFMFWQKRLYVNNKYNLGANNIDPTLPLSSGKGSNPNSNIMVAPCTNEGFESGNITGWTATRGTNTNSCNYPSTPISIGLAAPYLAIQTTPFVDALIGAIPNSPFAGSRVLKINDANPNFDVVKLTQTFPVTNTNFLYEFAYIFITNNSPHLCCDQPHMYVRVRDCLGNLLSCPNFSILPPATNSAVCPGIGPASWTSNASVTYNASWQKFSIDLTNYLNSCVTIEVFVADCIYGGHFGYSYFDSNCSNFGFTVNSSTVYPAPTQTVNVNVLCGTTATIAAPGGLSPYMWNGPATSTIVSQATQSIQTSVPGNYTIQMTPAGVCNPIFRIVNLKFVPPLGATASPTAICSAGTNTSAVLTATGATTYTWSNPVSNSPTIAVSPTTTTTYTVSGTTSTCSTIFTLQVTVNPNPTISVGASSNVVCSGGQVTLTANGATTYTWMPGSLTGSQVVVTPTANTTYTAFGANGGCPGTATINISVIGSPTVNAFASSPTVCPGGSSNLFAGGALTYTWQPGNLIGSNVVVTPASTTIYTVTGQILSCSGTATVQVAVSSGPTINVTATPTTICSASGGTAQLVASGAVSYTWMPGSVISPTLVITPTATTIYTVTGVNALLCPTTLTISFSVTPTPTLNIVQSSTAVCAGSSATLTGSGATTYTWMPGSITTPVVVVTPVSNTTYTLTGANGICVSTKTVALVVNANPTVTASRNPTVVCSGNSSTLTASGALTYTWNPGVLVGATVAVAPATTTNYTVTGTNAAGCTATAATQVSVNPTPTLNPVANPTAICVGGTATLSTIGATTYTWNPGNLAGSSVTVSPAATTLYTVTGANGNCISSKTVNLVVNPIPTVSAVSNPTVICAGNSATLTGFGALTYTWNPGSLTGISIVVSPTITTQYTITGSNGACTSTAAVSVSVIPSPTLTATSNPTSYCAGSGGTATLSGTGAASYTWNPGNLSGATVTVSPLVTTIYTLSGSNAAACVSTKTVTVTVIPIPTVNASASPTVICAGKSSTLTATGATTYTWNPGTIIGANIVVSPVITTQYTVTGGNGVCTSTAVVTVSVNANPVVSASSNPTVICSGNSATLTGVGALSYTWNPGSIVGSPAIVSPIVTTQYTLTGANAAGCTATAVANVSVNPTPTLNPIANPTAICVGATATLSTTGASTYTWNPGNLSGSSATVSPASTTIYTVVGASNNCTNTKTVQLIVNPLPTITAVSNPTAICVGNTATLTGSGASTYTWNPGALIGTSVAVSPVSTTVYTVVGTNTAGCTSSKTVQLIVNPLPTVTAVANPTGICQGSGGSSTLSASGASTYVWNPGALPGTTVVVTPVVTTIYTVTGTTSLGCTSTRTVQVQIIPNPTITASASPTAVCAGSSATLTGSGAISYTWNPGALTGTSIVVNPTLSTTYTVQGSNAQCLSSSITVQVFVNPLPSFTLIPPSATVCSGQNLVVNVAGTQTSFTVQPGNIVGSTVFAITPTITTTYTVTGSNAFGCTSSKTIQVIVNPTPTITAIATPSNLCSGGNTTLTASGATSYTWNPGILIGATVVVTPTINTTYTVTGTSGQCSSTRTIQVNVGTTPTVTAVASPTLKCGPNPATLTASGATTYTWYPGALIGATVSVNPFATTVYTVVGANGSCTSIATVTLFFSPLPPVNAFANPVNLCSGNSSTLTGVGASSYTWFPGAATGQTVVVTPSVTTIYTVVGSNAAGCTNAATRTINVIPSPTLSPAANPTAICLGNSATLSVTGTNNYTWIPGPNTGSAIVVSPTTTTIYTVTGNVGPCTSTAALNLVVNPTPTLVNLSATSTLVCASAGVTMTASGANNYTWVPGNFISGTVVVNPLVTTTYTVTGANLSGCTKTAAITISVSPGPSITIGASANTICAGASVTLTPSGANTYSLYPGSSTGTVFVTSPTVTTTYTVLGANPVGCAGVNTIQIIVNPIPTLTLSASPSFSLCIGNSATLTASGANSYTWTSPTVVSSSITITPTANTIYTVIALSAAGCQTTETCSVYVTPTPTISVSATNTLVCQSNSVALIASGATNYTWMPGSLSGSNVVVSPTATTVYTVTGDNGGCSSSATVQIDVTPGPQNVTASATGTITCFVSSVGLLGSTTSTNVTYLWNGPNSFTSAAQNPTPITQSGTYTLTVTDLGTGCPLSVTCAVIGNTTIPNFSVTVSGNLGCNTTVTLMASSSTSAGITYTWAGPGSFTSAIQNPTINVAGDYTVSAFDVTTGCVGQLTISVLSNTTLPTITATIIPATCTGTSTNNDGTIILGPNGVKYDLVLGSTYTGTANYVTAIPIPTNGVITNTLANPGFTTAYTVRIFGFNGCFKDTTLILQPINCFNNVFGLTKAASTPSLVGNKYDVTFTVTAVNASFADLTNLILNENLATAFPLPATYSIVSPPVVTSQGSSLTINSAFDGSTSISLTSPSTSTLLTAKRDTIVFTVRIDPNGFFGPFVNSVVGFANDVNSLVVTDSSNDGFGWDPDQDGFPTNNNIPTVINLTPNTRLGIAKSGSASAKLSDDTYDFTYVVTVKNFGNDTLKFVQVKDSLAKTIPLPAHFVVKSAPVVTGTLLTANTAFNGNTDINLLSGINSLAPGQVDSIRFTINVTQDTVTVFRNTAIGYAINQFSTATRDSSQTGTNPDVNNNGNPNEVSDSDPTVIVIPQTDFFVPEVFTPNDDGKNDFFVIKGGKKLKLTVFNRWGNKVYEKSEYDNTWNGYPNASGLILGNNKLPQGTYYYIIEFSDAENKPITGYVVLQY